MQQEAKYNLIGTPSSAATLTAAFGGNTSGAILALGYRRLALDIDYTPGEDNAYAQILIQYSNEELSDANGSNGASDLADWRAFATSVPGTTQVDVYGQGGDQMSTTAGTPINVPTSGTSTASQAMKLHIAPDVDLNARWIRVLVKEKFTSTAGTIHVACSLT